MHEMSLVTEVVDIVVEAAERQGATRVEEVTLVVGELHDVVDELMESCFRFLAKGTVAQDASLTLVKTPVKVQCKDCGLVYPADLARKETLSCPECKSEGFRIFSGNEFTVKSITIL